MILINSNNDSIEIKIDWINRVIIVKNTEPSEPVEAVLTIKEVD